MNYVKIIERFFRSSQERLNVLLYLYIELIYINNYYYFLKFYVLKKKILLTHINLEPSALNYLFIYIKILIIKMEGLK